MESQLETWIVDANGKPVRIVPPADNDNNAWSVWGGGSCPVHPNDAVEVILRNGSRNHRSDAYGYRWSHIGGDSDIVAYRVANDHPQEDAFTIPINVQLTRPEPHSAPPSDVKAAIADEAKRIVTGARRAAYGTPEDNFARIAAYWNAYAQCKGWSVVFTAADVSPMMRGMKEARLVETPDHRDSFVDLCGYTLTGAEVNGVAA